MKKVVLFEEYVSEDNQLNEMIDPLTLLFAAGFVGYMYGKDIIKAHKENKVLRSESSEIRKHIQKLKDQKAKAKKGDKRIKADKIQKDIDRFEQKLRFINNSISNNNEKIEDFEENIDLRKDIESEVRDRSDKKNLSMGTVRSKAKSLVKKI